MGDSSNKEVVNFYLTFLELSIFKFSFLTTCNLIMTLIRGSIVSYPQMDFFIMLSAVIIIAIQVISILLNLTKAWLKKCLKIPIGLFYIVIFLIFIGINVFI